MEYARLKTIKETVDVALFFISRVFRLKKEFKEVKLFRKLLKVTIINICVFWTEIIEVQTLLM